MLLLIILTIPLLKMQKLTIVNKIMYIFFPFFHFQDRKPLLVTVDVDGKSYKFKHSLENLENGNSSSYPKRKCSINERRRKQSLSARLKPLFTKRPRKDKRSALEFIKQRFRSEKGVHYLDQYSRLLFPLGYTAFLLTYFVIYMAKWWCTTHVSKNS